MTTITKSQTTLTLGTEDGDVEIREDELPTITDEDLVMLGISRAELHRCFAEAAELMQGVDPLERKRAVADQRPLNLMDLLVGPGGLEPPTRRL